MSDRSNGNSSFWLTSLPNGTSSISQSNRSQSWAWKTWYECLYITDLTTRPCSKTGMKDNGFNWRKSCSLLPSPPRDLPSWWTGGCLERLKQKIKDLKWLKDTMQPTDTMWPLDGDRESDDSCAAKRNKALCYEVVSLRVLQDPEDKSKATLALEVMLTHYKGCDRKSKP